MRVRRSLGVVASGLALVLVLSGASLAVEGGSGPGSSAGADSRPLLQVGPAPFQFPDTTLGTYSTPYNKPVISNNGSSTDTIDLITNDVSFSGRGADDYVITTGNCPGDGVSTIVLTSGQSCEPDILFLPGALGDRSATMTIQGSADASGFSVILQGTGSIGYYEVDQTGTVAHMAISCLLRVGCMFAPVIAMVPPAGKT